MGKILIVENEEKVQDVLVKIVEDINKDIEIFLTGSAEEALYISKIQLIDAFFIDILLSDYSGLELAMQIRQLENYKLTPIVFVTAVHSRELEAFRKIHCYDYILKPFSNNEIFQVFQEIITYGIDRKNNKLTISEKNNVHLINQEDLIYIESLNKNLFIKTIYEETEIKNYTLSKISAQLTTQFVQCHRSFIFNQSYVRKIDISNNILYLKKKKDPIPIGRKYKNTVMSLLEKNL